MSHKNLTIVDVVSRLKERCRIDATEDTRGGREGREMPIIVVVEKERCNTTTVEKNRKATKAVWFVSKTKDANCTFSYLSR